MDREKRTTRRSIPLSVKVEALKWLNKSSVSETARRFKVSRKQIRDWKKNESSLQQTVSSHRSRLRGAGRKITCEDLEEHITTWIVAKREYRLRVSRNMIKLEAEKWMKENQPSITFHASDGWLQKYLRRNRFTLRRSTTVSQKQPEDCVTKVVRFLRYVWRHVENSKLSPSAIFAMDETPLWIEPCRGVTIDRIGAKDVPLKSTGENYRNFLAQNCFLNSIKFSILFCRS